ncbi:MAG: undecaprenyl-phosphate glucose phosphotransferase [Planctomycetes bacterium]|nr:undecaprenyl-phosphate glucose phosphotransferase [Planctomycetota bacterium]MBI3848271.1 undecaprenyl-phosphate glucose phosphotransferase [Planctomycetota bacterium]
MLKKHSQLMVTLCLVMDCAMTAAAFSVAYDLRFAAVLVPLLKGLPDGREYVTVLPVALVICMVCYHLCRLYVPRRAGTLAGEWLDIVKATLLAAMALAATTFFFRRYEYSRTVLLFWLLFNVLFLGLARSAIRLCLREMRQKGWNLRHAIIVSAGKLGQNIAETLQNNPWTGIHLVGFLDDRPERIGRVIRGVPVIGRADELLSLVKTGQIDQVYFALSLDQVSTMEPLIKSLSQECVDVKLVPDFFGLVTLRARVAVFDGLPVFTLQESPYYGWQRVLKRSIDVVLSLIVLIVISPLLAVIAIIVRSTSPGPVFYRQERVGIDGHVFRIFKFRTMLSDAESETGATFARRDDPRATPIGRFLRRTSLDEIPQFFNVLKGEMSIVGPRPERPVFIEDFKNSLPRYMLRHHVKAGITGWAQVNGWRGDTSLRKRLQYDLYYIENWSLGFDFRIMLLTFLRGFVHKNAF